MKSRIGRPCAVALGVLIAAVGAGLAIAAVTPAQQAILDKYTADAKAQDTAFSAPSPERGKAFFLAKHTGGKPDLASCTSCHSSDPVKPGKTRAGKEIAPLAISVNAKRFTDAADVEKWFKRNCSDVLGRECTASEKSDFVAYMLSQ